MSKARFFDQKEQPLKLVTDLITMLDDKLKRESNDRKRKELKNVKQDLQVQLTSITENNRFFNYDIHHGVFINQRTIAKQELDIRKIENGEMQGDKKKCESIIKQAKESIEEIKKPVYEANRELLRIAVKMVESIGITLVTNLTTDSLQILDVTTSPLSFSPTHALKIIR